MKPPKLQEPETSPANLAEPLRRAERKRQIILDAASELFLRQGFAGASMDEVAAVASISKQTLYKHFASKEVLFIEVVQSMAGGAANRVQEALIEPADSTEVPARLHAHADRLLDIVLTPRLLQLRRLVIGEASRFPDLGRALYAAGPGRSIALLTTTFARWAERGLLRVDDPAMAAIHFNWLIMGEPINQAMFHGDGAIPDTASRKAHVAGGVRVFLTAYGADRTEENFMSYDLMVFEPGKAPADPTSFLTWFRKVAEWKEPHDYNDPAFTTHRLQAWYRDMIKLFPAMNGPDAANDFDNDAVTGYSCASAAIYCDFRWNKAEDAYDHVKTLARKHALGFFDVSGAGDVWLPDARGHYAISFRAEG